MKAKPAMDWDYITERAKDVADMRLKEMAQFHYFNPNGIRAQWVAACQKIDDMVDAGIVPSGWILAYGYLSSYEETRLRKLVTRSRPPSSNELFDAIKSLESKISYIQGKIDERLGVKKTK